MGVLVAFIWGYLVGLVWGPLGVAPEWAQGVNVFGGYVITTIFVGPLLIQMLLRKSFSGFRIQIARLSIDDSRIKS
jgi:hypothetical protein